MEAIRMTLMQKDEIGEAARVLSEAMLDNPLHVTVLGGNGEAQRREIETMFTGMLQNAPEIVYLAREAERIVGVMRMKSCAGFKPFEEPNPTSDEHDTDWRKQVWQAAWARNEPKGQHWHLGPVGVLPGHQGRGIGTLFMERFCTEVDACGAEAYLETDLLKNVRFYEKFGFKVVAESDILGEMSRYMLRPAKSQLRTDNGIPL